MTLEEFLVKQLDVTYGRIQSDQERSSKIRNWCVTVWIGALVLVSAEKVQLGHLQKVLLPLLPVLFFWVLDALEHVFIFIHRDHAKRLESFLLGLEPYDPAIVQRHSLEHGVPAVPYRKKLRLFLRNMFLIETVVFFYGALLAVTALLSIL